MRIIQHCFIKYKLVIVLNQSGNEVFIKAVKDEIQCNFLMRSKLEIKKDVVGMRYNSQLILSISGYLTMNSSANDFKLEWFQIGRMNF